MIHLSDTEFTDLLDGRLPPSRAAHLEVCAACRDQAGAIRAAHDWLARETVPEPSPLYWEHMAARVGEAIRQPEDGPARTASGWLPRWAAWAGGAVCAILLLAIAWARLPAGSTPALPQASPDLAAIARAAADFREEMDNDPEWSVVRAAAADLEWEDIPAAGIAPTPGAAEMVILELNDDERAELARLLEEEMKRSGA
jgi:hypothetical protein